MAWVDGRPLAFDCIEFAPELRWIDVISEVAFLIMDLQARDKWALAARFLNRYLELTGDYAGVALLPFYQAYRAAVRAKVDAIRLGQADVEQDERIGIERECQHYLELASRYSTFTAPGLLITRGPSGSGKTTWSNTLVEDLGAIRIRSDVERKRLFGLPAEQSAAAGPGEGIYTAEASRATYEKLLELSAELLDAGYPVIVDAVFAREEQRRPFRQLAEEQGVPFLILDFQASGNVLRERLVGRGKDASDADLAVLDRQLAAWQPLVEGERSASLAIDTEQAWTGEKLAAEVRKALASG
jgi:predicted kinase